jgi:hypothetical protein
MAREKRRVHVQEAMGGDLEQWTAQDPPECAGHPKIDVQASHLREEGVPGKPLRLEQRETCRARASRDGAGLRSEPASLRPVWLGHNRRDLIGPRQKGLE